MQKKRNLAAEIYPHYIHVVSTGKYKFRQLQFNKHGRQQKALISNYRVLKDKDKNFYYLLDQFLKNLNFILGL